MEPRSSMQDSRGLFLSWINPISHIEINFFKIHSNIDLPSTPLSFPIFVLSVLCPSYFSFQRGHGQKNNFQAKQIKLIIILIVSKYKLLEIWTIFVVLLLLLLHHKQKNCHAPLIFTKIHDFLVMTVFF